MIEVSTVQAQQLQSSLVEMVDSQTELADLLELDLSKLEELPEKEIHLRDIDQDKRLPMSGLQRKVDEECGRALDSMMALSQQVQKVRLRLANRLGKTQQEHLEQYSSILKIRESQTLMVLYILEHQHLSSFQKGFDSNFQTLGKFRISSEALKRGVNFNMIGAIHLREQKYLQIFDQSISRLASQDLLNGQIKYLMDSLQLIAYKIHAVSVIYPKVLSVPLDALFNEDQETSARWKRIKQYITYADVGSKQEVADGFRFTRDRVVFMQAMVGLVHQLQNQEEDSEKSTGFIMNMFKGGAKLLKYAFSDEKATRKADKFKLNPDANLVRNMFEFDKNIVTKTAIQTYLPSMKYSKLISIPRHFKEINSELVLGWMRDQNYRIEPAPLEYEDKLQEPLQTYTEKMFAENTDQNKRITIRVNCAFKLHTIHQKPKSILQHFFKKPLQDHVQALALHMHGGGFICQNTFLHQTYIRRWANMLNIPFFSVEYRKSPQWAYPAALDDSFQTYMWLVTLFDQVYDARPPKIILVGDSAGGNLATGVTALAVKFRVRIPDALALVYPAFDLCPENFFPSRIASLDDYLLPTSVLRLCKQSYIQGPEFNPQKDAFISPILLSDELLKQFPKTNIFVGSSDPLHDESILFLQRMINLNKKVHMTVFDGFIHGFLQFDMPVKQMKFLRRVVQEIGEKIGEMVGITATHH